MYYKKPYRDHYELIVVTRIFVLQKRPDGDLDVRFEMADGDTLDSVYTLAEFGDLIANPQGIVV
ncbi:MAG: hypothetical protein JWQ21_973 [Herminiimonas sp.]|nr:hypothetical protein [Herminiimonas sp.]